MVVKDEIKALLAPITEAIFLADTPKSALEMLRNYDKIPAKSGLPFILLLLPLTESTGRVFTTVNCSFVLGTVTKKDYSTDERQVTTFTPILEPIYQKFEKLIRGGSHTIKSNARQNIEKINQYYWGQDSTILENYIDCIEVRNIELQILNKNC
jgi:hypothetical protein